MQVAQKHIYIYIYNIKNIVVNKQKLIDMLYFIKNVKDGLK